MEIIGQRSNTNISMEGKIKKHFIPHNNNRKFSAIGYSHPASPHIDRTQRYIDESPHHDLRQIEFYEKFPFLFQNHPT